MEHVGSAHALGRYGRIIDGGACGFKPGSRGDARRSRRV